MTTDKLDKLDTATIRELLTVCERARSVEQYAHYPEATSVAFEQFRKEFMPSRCIELLRYALELSDKVDLLNAEIKRLQGERNASVVYGAELYEQLQSQAAELERLRGEKADVLEIVRMRADKEHHAMPDDRLDGRDALLELLAELEK